MGDGERASVDDIRISVFSYFDLFDNRAQALGHELKCHKTDTLAAPADNGSCQHNDWNAERF
jgi:hypothetical protein